MTIPSFFFSRFELSLTWWTQIKQSISLFVALPHSILEVDLVNPGQQLFPSYTTIHLPCCNIDWSGLQPRCSGETGGLNRFLRDSWVPTAPIVGSKWISLLETVSQRTSQGTLTLPLEGISRWHRAWFYDCLSFSTDQTMPTSQCMHLKA